MPTRPEFGEGRVGRGSNRHMHPFRSAGVVGTARTHGGSGNEVVRSSATHCDGTLDLEPNTPRQNGSI